MACPSQRIPSLLPPPSSSSSSSSLGPRLPALHPAAPPDSSFATTTPLREVVVGCAHRSAPSAPPSSTTDDTLAVKYEDLMRFMRAVNRDAMHQEVSSPQAAGGGGEVSSSSGGRENAGLGFLRLPVKRRHSEVDATLPPQKVSSFSHPQTPVLPQETTEPEQSASFPAQIEVPSITEMQAIDGLRALATSEADTPESQPIPSIETPAPTCITVATCPPPAPTTKATPNPKKLARDHLFDAIVAASMRANGSTVDRSGNPVPSADDMLWRRIITGPDDLERAESVRLFEILEACSYATQPETPVTTTRGNIDRFFDAVFRNWDPEDWDAEAAKTARPDFSVSAETIAGKVCAHPSSHHNIIPCMATPECDTNVIAKVTYVYHPHSVKLEFFAKLPPGTTSSDSNGSSSTRHSIRARRQQQQQTQPRTPGEPQLSSSSCSSLKLTALNPTERDDIRWITATDWTGGVRDDLQKKIVARLHKYNKHQAIWQARRFVQGWARGALPEGSIFDRTNGSNGGGSSGDVSVKRPSMGIDGEGLGFLTADGAKMSLQILMNMQ